MNKGTQYTFTKGRGGITVSDPCPPVCGSVRSTITGRFGEPIFIHRNEDGNPSQWENVIDDLEGKIQQHESEIDTLEGQIDDAQEYILGLNEQIDEQEQVLETARVNWSNAINPQVSSFVSNTDNYMGPNCNGYGTVTVPWSVETDYETLEIEMAVGGLIDQQWKSFSIGEPWPYSGLSCVPTNVSVLWDRYFLLKGQYEALAFAYTTVPGIIKDLEGQIAEQEQQITGYQDEILSLEAKIADIKAQIDKLYDAIAAFVETGLTPEQAADLAAAEFGREQLEQDINTFLKIAGFGLLAFIVLRYV